MRSPVLGLLAAITAAVFALVLAWRPITSLDLGYHLVYGGVFLEEGRIIDDATFVVPAPTPEEARGDVPPGTRFEPDGRYSFSNTNWLSQVIMSLAHRAAGPTALVLLTVLLIAVILGSQAVVVRRVSGSWVGAGPVWLATGLTCWERFYLRPELFGNACLVAQLALLAGPLTKRRIVAVLLLQLLAVNVHSYWVLGVAFLAAAVAELLVRGWLPRRSGTRSRSRPAARARLLPVAAVVGCFLLGAAHPAGTRNLTLPVEMLAYMQEHEIGGKTRAQVQSLWNQGKGHSWQDTGELFPTLSPESRHLRATQAFVVMLALAGPAAIVLLGRGQIALAAIVVLLALVGLPVRRNMATAGFVVWPLVGSAAVLAAHAARARLRRHAPRLTAAVLVLSSAAALYGTFSVVTNRFYRSESRDARFGAGFSRIALPIDACQWLDDNLDRPQPVFANFNASSSVLFFSKRVSGVSILTNTWAFPPARKARLQAMHGGTDWIDPFASDACLDLAVFYALPSVRPLLSRLASAPDWAVVYLEGSFVIFARRNLQNASLVARELTRETLDIGGLVARSRALDAYGEGLRRTAGTLIALDWTEHAATAAIAWENAPARIP